MNLLFDTLSQDDVNRGRLFNFLSLVNCDFTPPLDHKVDLSEFLKKILKLATIFVCLDEDIIVGVVVIYCNDFERQQSYITLTAVDKFYRGIGIARSLMKLAIKYSSDEHFNTIAIHTNNRIALSLYTSLGFTIQDSICGEDETVRYFLVRQT